MTNDKLAHKQYILFVYGFKFFAIFSITILNER